MGWRDWFRKPAPKAETDTKPPKVQPEVQPSRPCVKLIADAATVRRADGMYIGSGVITLGLARIRVIDLMERAAEEMGVKVVAVRATMPGGLSEQWRWVATCPCDATLRGWMGLFPDC